MTRIAREKRTVEAMITLYCREQHQSSNGVCLQCGELLEYAWHKIDRCPFANKKPTCAKCTVHCYKPSIRQTIIAVMRYSGPRMIRKHPLLAIAHIIDGFKSRR